MLAGPRFVHALSRGADGALMVDCAALGVHLRSIGALEGGGRDALDRVAAH